MTSTISRPKINKFMSSIVTEDQYNTVPFTDHETYIQNLQQKQMQQVYVIEQLNSSFIDKILKRIEPISPSASFSNLAPTKRRSSTPPAFNSYTTWMRFPLKHSKQHKA